MKSQLFGFTKKIYRTIIPNQYLVELGKELKVCKSVLDLGCGFKSPIINFPKTFYSVGVDIYPSYVEESKRKKIHDEYFVMDVMKADKKFKPKSFDCVIALGVIEHITRKEGFMLLQIMEKIAKKKVIIFTPNGLLPSTHHNEQEGYNHKSGWVAKDFTKLGYRVYGVNGLKSLKYDHADPDDNTQVRFKPKIFWKLVSDISAIFLKNNPDRSFEILCVKDIS